MKTEEQKTIEALTAAHEYRDRVQEIDRLQSIIKETTARLADLYEAAGGEDPDLTRILRGHADRLVWKLGSLRGGFGEMAGSARSTARSALWQRNYQRRRASEIAAIATTTEAVAN